MNLKRVLAAGVGGGAVVVWIAAAATSVSQPAVNPAPPMNARAIETSGAALAAEIAKLHERLRPSATPLQTRDLFHYAPRREPRAVASVALSAPTAFPVESPVRAALPLVLIGIAEDGPQDAPVRTAILSGMNDVFFAKPGDVVVFRYRIVTVSSTDVQMVDTVDQSAFHLTLP